MFTCDICKATFKSKRSLGTHVSSHFKLTFEDGITEKKNKNKGITIDYMVKVDGKYLCKICNKIIKYKRSHIKIHKDRNYKCKECSKRFYSPWSYKLHIDTHKKDKPFSCHTCPKKFQNKIFLKNHIKTHNNKLYSCKVCDKKVACPYILKRHEEIHVKKPHFCPLCKKTFKNTETLEIHFLRHSFENTFSCDLCSKIFNCKNKLKDHLKSHSSFNIEGHGLPTILDNGGFSCGLCKELCDSKNTLLEHMTNFHVDYLCKICNGSFKTYKVLKIHLLKHIPENTYYCNNCNFSCNNKNVLTQHVKNCKTNNITNIITFINCVICKEKIDSVNVKCHIESHNKNGLFYCKICDKSFTETLTLNKHLLRHKAIKKYSCNFCDKTFVSRYLVKLHEIKHGDKSLECFVCEKKFHLDGELKQHILTHRNEKPFSCSICNKTFKRKELLRVHLTHHDNIKKFLCTVCGKSYLSIASLKQHESIHGSDVFNCQLCDKVYKCKKMLNRHLKSCGNSFLCGFCGKSFKYKSYLKKHESFHNGVQFTCEFCNGIFRTRDILKNHIKVVHASKSNCDLTIVDGEEY